MPNPENLEAHRFEPGQTGNPNGRPNGTKNRGTILKKWLEVAAKVKNPETGITIEGTVEDKIAIGLIAKAIKGDVQAAREILDSIYGKSAQPLEHSGGLMIKHVKQEGNDPLLEEDV